MDEKSKNQVERFTEYLAALAIKLIEAEKQRDEAQRAADEWYKHWQARMAELKTAEERLAAADARIAELEEKLADKIVTGGRANA